jgi:hypothetical protein
MRPTPPGGGTTRSPRCGCSPRPGHDLFAEEHGTNRLKPDLEGACVVGDHLRWFQRGDRRRGAVPKVEGLAILTASADTLGLLAVVDADDPALASPVLHLTVSGYA